MVQSIKMNVFWVCFEMAREQTVNAVRRLWPNRWPVRRVPTVLVILKNYRKYRQYGTSLNKNKVKYTLSVLVTLLSKEKLKIKSSGFSRPLHSVFCNS